MASMTLDFPLPLGPTIDVKHCKGWGGREEEKGGKEGGREGKKGGKEGGREGGREEGGREGENG